MVPAPVIGRYGLYKLRTAKFEQWLVHTASTCCDIAAITGKSRQGPVQTVKLSTRDRLKLADAIAQAKPPVSIPVEIWSLLSEVIAGRQCSVDIYAAQPAAQGSQRAKDNATHAFFLKVLKQARDALAKLVIKKSRIHSPSAAEKPASASKSSNIFDQLTVEDLLEEEASEGPLPTTACGQDPSISNTHASQAGIKFVFEDAHADDMLFELRCLLLDWKDLQDRVLDTCHEYRRGEVSWSLAGMTADVAFSRMRRTSAELTAKYPQIKGWYDLLEVLQLDLHVTKGLVLLVPRTSDSKAVPRNSEINLAACLCPSSALLLCQSQRRVADAVDKKDKQAQRLPTALDSFRSRKFGELLDEHHDRLVEHVRFIWDLLEKKKKRAPEQDNLKAPPDEFFTALMPFYAGADLPIWLPMACQTYAEIVKILGKDLAFAADAWIDCQQQSQEVVQRYNAFSSKTFRSGCLKAVWQDHFDAVTSHSADLAIWMRKLKNSDASTQAALLRDAPYGHLPLEMMLLLPVTPCTLMFSLNVGNQQYGRLLCDDGQAVLIIAHLYDMARKLGLLTDTWADMEWFIGNSSSQRSYVMATKDSQGEWEMVRRLELALGVPLASLSKKGPTTLPSPKTVAERAKAAKAMPGFIAGVVQKCQEAEAIDRATDPITDVVLQYLRNKADGDLEDADKTNTTGRRGKSDRPYTSLQLLDTFKTSFRADEMQLYFDYTSFWLLCAELVEAIKVLAQAKTSGNPQSVDLHGHQVIHGVMCDAAAADAISRSMKKTTLARAAKILAATIAREGDKFTKAAAAQSSGQIPDDFKPKLASLAPFKSGHRKMLEENGLKFSGDGHDAAVYAPVTNGEQLVADVIYVEHMVEAQMSVEGFDGCWIGLTREMHERMGAQRWGIAFALVRFSQGLE